MPRRWADSSAWAKKALKFARRHRAQQSAPLWRLIFGLGILHVGVSASRALADHFPNLDAMMAASVEELQRIPDVGEVVGQSIHDFFREPGNLEIVEETPGAGLQFKGEEKNAIQGASEIKATTWVITGTFSQARDEIAETIIARGGKVSGSVSKKTSFVLAGADAGSKLEKAKKLGLRVIDEAEFRKMLL